jgi:hypothetical protein
MKFTLIYDGPLPAGKKRRAEYASKIRNELHSQLRDLWNTHVLMRQLRHEARAYKNSTIGGVVVPRKPVLLPDYWEEPPPLRNDEIDLCPPINVEGTGAFLPVVRSSLYLACALDILFLRHEDPGRLFDLGGDIDNRLKCFFDGLTIPNPEQAKHGARPCANPLYCLMEDDKHISDFSVRSGRLLGRNDKNADDVRIQVDVTIKVLRVFHANQFLIGG